MPAIKYLETLTGEMAAFTDVCSAGRDPESDLAVDDPGMAKCHVVLTSMPDGLLLTPFSPVSVNGLESGEALVEHLDWIEAGSTLMRVWVEGCAPPEEAETCSDRVIEVLSSYAGPLYAVVEPRLARAPVSLSRTAPLYLTPSDEVPEGAKLSRIPNEEPILAVEPAGDELASLVRAVWGRNCAFFFTSRADVETLRRRFVKYLFGEVGGRGLGLPYYTPRFLAAVLDAPVNRVQADFNLFVERAVFEGDRPSLLLEYTAGGGTRRQELDEERCRPRLRLQAHWKALCTDGDAYVNQMLLMVEDEAALGELLRTGRSFGLKSGPALTQYVDLCREFGADFAASPQVSELLRNGPYSPDNRLDLFTLAVNRDRWPEDWA